MNKWPHAPIHILDKSGTYMVTSGTYKKEKFFHDSEKLELLHSDLHSFAKEFGWELQAWSVFPNHYHFIAASQEPSNLRDFISKLHSVTARNINREDDTPGRKVWFQYWDTRITYQSSYLARLNYVHCNPAHHHIVDDPRKYKWCSAKWFEGNAGASFYNTVTNMKTDRVKVIDEF